MIRKPAFINQKIFVLPTYPSEPFLVPFFKHSRKHLVAFFIPFTLKKSAFRLTQHFLRHFQARHGNGKLGVRFQSRFDQGTVQQELNQGFLLFGEIAELVQNLKKG